MSDINAIVARAVLDPRVSTTHIVLYTAEWEALGHIPMQHAEPMFGEPYLVERVRYPDAWNACTRKAWRLLDRSVTISDILVTYDEIIGAGGTERR